MDRTEEWSGMKIFHYHMIFYVNSKLIVKMDSTKPKFYFWLGNETIMFTVTRSEFGENLHDSLWLLQGENDDSSLKDSTTSPTHSLSYFRWNQKHQ